MMTDAQVSDIHTARAMLCGTSRAVRTMLKERHPEWPGAVACAVACLDEAIARLEAAERAAGVR
jgi:hypothetical protein